MTGSWNKEISTRVQVMDGSMEACEMHDIIVSMQHATLTKIISDNQCSHKRVDGGDLVLIHK